MAIGVRGSQNDAFNLIDLRQNATGSKNPCCSAGQSRWRWPGWLSARRASLEHFRDVPRKLFRTKYLYIERKNNKRHLISKQWMEKLAINNQQD